MVEFSTAKLMIHVFQLHEDGPAAEELDSTCDTSAANHWMLPNCGLIIEGIRVRVGQPSIYNSCRFSFKYVLNVLIEQTGKVL